ncbi:centriole, cilia and spindle-associated protein [Thalassophryne amazonica]|uniref:centriole, cilia and spindle-associated protein n=1 Tax=Thalassophryne amazonica TaxID=390379 RepID=UPI001472434F|nr:centriole, cilia and spindle-associated protein [Thalassophryne amazonica]
MVTKKVRTEYMKKFRDPKWETFSKCYEDSLKYRLTRRLMEHSHNPWFWEGWDSDSDSSGWSMPHPSRNKVAPLSVAPPTALVVRQSLAEVKSKPGPEVPTENETSDEDIAPSTENAVSEAKGARPPEVPNAGRPADDTATDNGPADSRSSDAAPVNQRPKRRHRRRTPRSEPVCQHSSYDNSAPASQKPVRAKSQQPTGSKEENRQTASVKPAEVRRSINANHTTSTPPGRQAAKRSSNLDRWRARSADLDALRRSLLKPAEDHWMTEYMRCFSARLR